MGGEGIYVFWFWHGFRISYIPCIIALYQAFMFIIRGVTLNEYHE